MTPSWPQCCTRDPGLANQLYNNMAHCDWLMLGLWFNSKGAFKLLRKKGSLFLLGLLALKMMYRKESRTERERPVADYVLWALGSQSSLQSFDPSTFSLSVPIYLLNLFGSGVSPFLAYKIVMAKFIQCKKLVRIEIWSQISISDDYIFETVHVPTFLLKLLCCNFTSISWVRKLSCPTCLG